MFKSGFVVAASVMAIAVGSPAYAATSAFTDAQSAFVYIPKFDGSLGHLTSVSFENEFSLIQGFESEDTPLVHALGTLGLAETGAIAVDEYLQSFATGLLNPTVAAVSVIRSVAVTFTGDLSAYVNGSSSFGGDAFVLVGIFNPFTLILPNGSVAPIATTGKFGAYVSTRVTYTYDVAPSVPEPATWAMMLVGFGMMGAAMRYRRRATATVFA